MNKPQPKNSALDWLLYFGSADERLRAGADRAGHVAFFFCFFAALIDFLWKFPAFKAAPDQGAALGMVSLDLIIILGGGLLYGIQWVRAGITFSDKPLQRRLLHWMAPLAGIASAGLALFPWKTADRPWSDHLPGALAAGLAAWGLSALLFWGLDRWARKNAKKKEDSLD